MKILVLSLIFSSTVLAADYNKLANETFRKVENTLTIQIIRSTYPIDWSSTTKLLFSFVKNKYWFPITKSTIGHVTAEINCTIDGQNHRFFSGQAAKDLMAYRDKMDSGYGLSILNRPHLENDYPLVWVAGRLNTREEMEPRFERQLDKDNLSLFSVKLQSAQCQEVLGFMKEYYQRTEANQNAGNNYGFGADPLKFEGSGCAPYVQGLFRKAGLQSIANAMVRRLSVPKEMIGHPEKGKKVSLIRFLSPMEFGLQKPDYYEFTFPDPEKLYQFLTKIYREELPFKILAKKALGPSRSYYVMIEPFVDSTKEL